MGANVRVTTGASVGQCAARSRSGGGSASVGTPATSLPAFIVPVDIHSQDPGPGFNCYLVLTLAQKRDQSTVCIAERMSTAALLLGLGHQFVCFLSYLGTIAQK